MNLPYQPAFGGASKANRVVAEMLAGKGNSVCVIAPAHTQDRESADNVKEKNNSHLIAEINGVEVHSVDTDVMQLRSYLAHHLQLYNPDCIAVSSEDPLQGLLSEAINYDSSRVIYLAHSPSCLPFGPSSFFKTERGLALMKRSAIVLAVSRFCADYIRKWSDITPTHAYLPVYGKEPFPNYGCFENNYITIINPCTYKGIDIFIQLAQMHEAYTFAAVPSWGTTRIDHEKLKSLPNIKLLEPTPDINKIFNETKILIVPSISLENFPMVIIEGMLRGIPVIASNIGGICEAKLGTNYIIQVNPITAYTNKWDEKKLWVPIVPVQDIGPWNAALNELLSDKDAYRSESLLSRDRAIHFVKELSSDPIEHIFSSVAHKPH